LSSIGDPSGDEAKGFREGRVFSDVQAALDNREGAVIDAVEQAYLRHREGRTDLPHSSFLRFGADRPDRIIALPGRIDDGSPIAGIKWIASFPGNVQRGMARASALLIVNSTETGRPTAVIESSIISAQRTAASAALAARELHAIGDETTLGLIGCGVINFEVARFVLSVAPRLATLLLYDLDPARAETFATRVQQELAGLDSFDLPVFEHPTPVRPPEIIDAGSTRSVPVAVGIVLATITAIGLVAASWASARSVCR